MIADAGGVSALSIRSSPSGMVGTSSGSGIAHVSFGSSDSSSCVFVDHTSLSMVVLEHSSRRDSHVALLTVDSDFAPATLPEISRDEVQTVGNF